MNITARVHTAVQTTILELRPNTEEEYVLALSKVLMLAQSECAGLKQYKLVKEVPTKAEADVSSMEVPSSSKSTSTDTTRADSHSEVRRFSESAVDKAFEEQAIDKPAPLYTEDGEHSDVLRYSLRQSDSPYYPDIQ